MVGTALYRKCKYCGAPLSLREMPAGQWVAFDYGTDTVHQCAATQPRANGNRVRDHAQRTAKLGGKPHTRAGSGSSWTVGTKPKSGTATGRRERAAAHSEEGSTGNLKEATPTVATEYTAILRLLETAIREQRCVRMRYYTASRQALTDRVVEPNSLIRYRSGYLLHAFCHFRGEHRHFAVGNILRAELLNETFTPRPVAKPGRQINREGSPAVNRWNSPVMGSSPQLQNARSAGASGCLLPVLIVVVVMLWLLLPISCWLVVRKAVAGWA